MTTAPTFMVTTGYNGTIRTWQGFLEWLDNQGLEPEFKRRVIAIVHDSHVAGRPLSVGSAKRSKIAADNLFLSRYHKVSGWQSGAVLYKGSYYMLDKGEAPAMPSDRTYHVRMTPPSTIDPDADGLYCLAVDFIGDLKYLEENQQKYGIDQFKDENGEIWHGQAMPIPDARRNYQYVPSAYYPLKPWVLPNTPTPTPTKLYAAKATQRKRSDADIAAGRVNNPIEVRAIQLFCNFWKFRDSLNRTLIVDNDYGSKTDQAVRGMQLKMGIESDGIWGPQTQRTVQGFLDYMTAVANAGNN